MLIQPNCTKHQGCLPRTHHRFWVVHDLLYKDVIHAICLRHCNWATITSAKGILYFTSMFSSFAKYIHLFECLHQHDATLLCIWAGQLGPIL